MLNNKLKHRDCSCACRHTIRCTNTHLQTVFCEFMWKSIPQHFRSYSVVVCDFITVTFISIIRHVHTVAVPHPRFVTVLLHRSGMSKPTVEGTRQIRNSGLRNQMTVIATILNSIPRTGKLEFRLDHAGVCTVLRPP